MAGMYTTCIYPNFSTKDAEKFERRLTKWCKSIRMPGKSMLVFDANALSLRDKATIEKNDDKEVYQVVLKEITFAYICINGSMCIMYKVWENKTQSVMYNMPLKWDGTELWIPDD